METLFAYFVPCLMVLFVPILLAVHTIGCVYGQGSCVKASPLILLNVAVAISILVLVVDKQISTLATLAMVSYSAVMTLLVAVMAASLILRIWKRVNTRSKLQLDELREEYGSLSQSFLPY